MSALAAVAFLDGDRPVSTAVAAMLAASPHRGREREQATLGRCAVGVVQSSDTTSSTSLAQVGRFLVAVAGHVDDVTSDELRDDPTAQRSAAALIACGWERYGELLPTHLRGAYAAVVTDGARIWAWRDHLGFGSLFYRHTGDAMYVATEAKQVLAGAQITPVPDLDVVESILFSSYDDETPSALRGVERLQKSTLLRGPRCLERARYWKPEELLERGRYTDAEVEDRFHSLMSQAVDRVLRDRSAVSLSGGIDSPAVAAYGAPLHLARTGRPLGAVTAVYPDYPDVDERGYVELVAGHLGVRLHCFPQQSRLLDRIDYWMRLFDGPVPRMWVGDVEEAYLQAARQGYDTLLTGEIAEFVVDLRGGLVPHLLGSRRWSAALHRLRRQHRNGVTARELASQTLSGLAPAPARLLARRFRAERSLPVPPWLDRAVVNAHEDYSAQGARRRWHELQLSGFVGPGLGVEADSVVQAVTGVTCRRPWADVDLWEFFLSLPAEQKFPDGRTKALVRQLLRGRVPDPILDRRDKTFFSSALMGRLDYPALRRWLLRPEHRFSGVDYALLARHLEQESLDLSGCLWAKNLANSHAFLEAV